MMTPENNQEIIRKKVQPVVARIMEERPIFKDHLDYEKIVQELVKLFYENLSFDEFNNMSENSLKTRCSSVMGVELLGTIGNDFTPEQMKIFDDAVKRK